MIFKFLTSPPDPLSAREGEMRYLQIVRYLATLPLSCGER